MIGGSQKVLVAEVIICRNDCQYFEQFYLILLFNLGSDEEISSENFRLSSQQQQNFRDFFVNEVTEAFGDELYELGQLSEGKMHSLVGMISIFLFC